ncbi:MAG: hypothetical protein ABW104_16690 [Candidatus Thiodiazotropha sp. 6PLUC2]
MSLLPLLVERGEWHCRLCVGIGSAERVTIPLKGEQPEQLVTTEDTMSDKAAIGGFLGVTKAILALHHHHMRTLHAVKPSFLG